MSGDLLATIVASTRRIVEVRQEHLGEASLIVLVVDIHVGRKPPAPPYRHLPNLRRKDGAGP